jgi:hypothetical protein
MSPVRTDSFNDLFSVSHRRSPATVPADPHETLSTAVDSSKLGRYCTKVTGIAISCTSQSKVRLLDLSKLLKLRKTVTIKC